MAEAVKGRPAPLSIGAPVREEYRTILSTEALEFIGELTERFGGRITELLTAREQRQARIDAQLPTDEKVQKADFVIDTGGTFGDTNRQVDRIVERLLELSAAAGR